MNVLFLSPGFPPTAWPFCAALRQRGVNVLGIGDEALADHSAARLALDDYVFEPHMGEYALLQKAVATLVERHGKLDRIDSHGEHWLETEARLRADFSVPGLQLADLLQQRSKLGMAALFAEAAIPYPATLRAESASSVRAFAAEQGFPLVFKPEVGSGAVDTFAVANAEELERALLLPLAQHLVQPFIAGNIVTYDGLADRAGNIVFATSHTYDVGIMQVRQTRRDGHYYSLRAVPPALAELGERSVRAFKIRERFFHLEFFEREGGSYVALEMNLRPPGGFTTELMNFAADMDVYALWAAILTGESVGDFKHRPQYHTAHAGRRHDRTYQLCHAELERSLGTTLVGVRTVPAAFAETMGDTAYLLRHPDLDALRSAIAQVQSYPITFRC